MSDPLEIYAITTDTECFQVSVWNEQCEFAQCVLKYLQLLEVGSAKCNMLEMLKDKKRKLELLNCYDVRDISGNTTNYNNFTYNQIKQLLS